MQTSVCMCQLVKKDFGKLVDGRASAPPLSLPIFAEIFQFSGRKNRLMPAVHPAGND